MAHGAPAEMRAGYRPVPPVPPPPGQGVAGQWPLQSFLELGALPGAIPCARLHARELMWEWGVKGLCDDVQILVSELVTNAVAAARSMAQVLPVRLWLLCDKARVLIVVWDGCPQAPVRIDASGVAESGRGLLLVETISDQWGSYPTPAIGGKAVWAVTAGTP